MASDCNRVPRNPRLPEVDLHMMQQPPRKPESLVASSHEEKQQLGFVWQAGRPFYDRSRKSWRKPQRGGAQERPGQLAQQFTPERALVRVTIRGSQGESRHSVTCINGDESSNMVGLECKCVESLEERRPKFRETRAVERSDLKLNNARDVLHPGASYGEHALTRRPRGCALYANTL